MRFAGWARRLLHILVRRDDVELDLSDEIRLHLDMETADLVRQGWTREAARREARLRLGGVEQTKESARDIRPLQWLGGSWLDFKLGVRVLVRYPGLSLISMLGMTVAIAIGATLFDAMAAISSPLPLPEGERIIALESWDAATSNQETRILHDFVSWRETLRSTEDLSAYRDVRRNLIIPGRTVGTVTVAETTASGFRLTRVAPLLGRGLVEEDEREGAPPVVVIGYDLWRSRFASDPSIIGKTVGVGRTAHTIVGVMPEGFAFPINHQLWTVLRADPADYGRREGPSIHVFGRLAHGATVDQAQAELTVVGQRAAAAFPETHDKLRPRIVPFTAQLFNDAEGWEFGVVQILGILLLVLVCVNVAILVYARTATRQTEIALRTALGASRRRIVGQLFAEALVLTSVAAATGLLLSRLSFSYADALLRPFGVVPFWMTFEISWSTVIYVLSLTVLSAIIVGVVPGLKATSGCAGQGLQHAASGSSAMRMGRTWNALIVAQVAFAMAILPTTVFFAAEFLRYGLAGPGFAAEQYLATQLVMDRDAPTSEEAAADEHQFNSRYGNVQTQLIQRLDSEAGASAVTFAGTLPGQEPTVRIEVDQGPSESQFSPRGARFGQIDIGFFDAFDLDVLSGRGFHSGDLAPDASAVIVNQTFVREFLGGENALGRRLRHAEG